MDRALQFRNQVTVGGGQPHCQLSQCAPHYETTPGAPMVHLVHRWSLCEGTLRRCHVRRQYRPRCDRPTGRGAPRGYIWAQQVPPGHVQVPPCFHLVLQLQATFCFSHRNALSLTPPRHTRAEHHSERDCSRELEWTCDWLSRSRRTPTTPQNSVGCSQLSHVTPCCRPR